MTYSTRLLFNVRDMALYRPARTSPKDMKTYSLGKSKVSVPKMPKGKLVKLAKPKAAKAAKIKL